MGFESPVLIGAGLIDGAGNAADTEITGNDAANRLIGLDGQDSLSRGNGRDTPWDGRGNDTLDGGGLADMREGGLGNDTSVATGNDTIVDTGGINTGTLGAAREHLVLTGTSVISGTGNAADNSSTDHRGANILSGLDGADTLAGGKDADAFPLRSAAEGGEVILGSSGSEARVEISAGFGAGLVAGMDPAGLWLLRAERDGRVHRGAARRPDWRERLGGWRDRGTCLKFNQ